MKSGKTTPLTVDEYLQTLPAPAREPLAKIRAIINKAVPGGAERISYGMPAVFLDDKVVAYFAAFKEHVGLFPPVRGDASLVMAAAPYAGPKGNLKFPFAKTIPYELIRKIAAGHAAAVLQKSLVKKVSRKSTSRADRTL